MALAKGHTNIARVDHFIWNKEKNNKNVKGHYCFSMHHPYLAGCKGRQVRRKARAPNSVCFPGSLYALIHGSQPSFSQDDVDGGGTRFGVAEN